MAGALLPKATQIYSNTCQTDKHSASKNEAKEMNCVQEADLQIIVMKKRLKNYWVLID